MIMSDASTITLTIVLSGSLCGLATALYVRARRRYTQTVWRGVEAAVSELGLRLQPGSVGDRWCAVGAYRGVDVEVAEFSAKLWWRGGRDSSHERHTSPITRFSARSHETDVPQCGLYRKYGGLVLSPASYLWLREPGLAQFRTLEERPGALNEWLTPALDGPLRAFRYLHAIELERGLFSLTFIGSFERGNGIEDALELLVELQRHEPVTVPEPEAQGWPRIPAVWLAVLASAFGLYVNLAYFGGAEHVVPASAAMVAVPYAGVLLVIAHYLRRRSAELQHAARARGPKRKDGIYRS